MRTGMAAIANRFRLPASEFWFCDYGFPIKIRFDAGDYLRVQFPHNGKASTRLAHDTLALRSGVGCISSASATIDFSSDYQQIAWRVGRRELTRKLAALTGNACVREVDFAPGLDFTAPATGTLIPVLRSLLDCIAVAPDNQLLHTELEQALVLALLMGSQHSYRDALTAKPVRAADWQVRRIEEYVAAHPDQPLRIEDLVTLTGTSARSIYRAFKQTRGYSPMDFAKRRRLERARAMLQQAGPTQTVTAIALASGFSELSHFSRAFCRAYGESPSTVLARSRSR
jgi:AraC-like DNA-binding protein